MMGKLAVITVGMFCFGYALIPLYKHICELTGINILAISERQLPGWTPAGETAQPVNSQVDTTRLVTIEFDANVRGPWQFKPEKRSIQVHPGELATVTYEIVNVTKQNLVGQAIPSYAPRHSASHFKKLECFCFEQQELKGSERREFPVVFVIDPKLPSDIATITLSYTFFEVAGHKSAAISATPRAGSTPKAGS